MGIDPSRASILSRSLAFDCVERIFAGVAAAGVVSGINIWKLGQPIEHYGGKRVVRIWHRTLRATYYQQPSVVAKKDMGKKRTLSRGGDESRYFVYFFLTLFISCWVLILIPTFFLLFKNWRRWVWIGCGCGMQKHTMQILCHHLIKETQHIT